MSNVIRAMFSEVPIQFKGLSFSKKLHFLVFQAQIKFFLVCLFVRPFYVSFPNGVSAGQRLPCVGFLVK